jgi:hypothetical protein
MIYQSLNKQAFISILQEVPADLPKNSRAYLVRIFTMSDHHLEECKIDKEIMDMMLDPKHSSMYELVSDDDVYAKLLLEGME